MMLLLLQSLLVIAVLSTGSQFPPHHQLAESNCKPNLCSASKWIPSSPNVSYYAEFNVPTLPENFSTAWNWGQTYFIYYNIIFESDPGYAGNNQFVPQLMLGGSVLCGSTGSPYYLPVWRDLRTWHIGAQYFFFIDNTSNPIDGGKTAHAAAGKMIDVYEGDIIYTKFELSEDREVWTLTQGIKGNNSAVSVVKATQPFMGLDSNSQSWTEDKYNQTRLGCCWELYNFHERGNYPNYMNYQIITTSNIDYDDYWSDWNMHETPNCTYSPSYNLSSTVNDNDTQQVTRFDIYYPSN